MDPYPPEEVVDANIINAGKETVTLVPGVSCFPSSDPSEVIVGGRVDCRSWVLLRSPVMAIWPTIGCLSWSSSGWAAAMDLISSPDETKTVVMTDHAAKDGLPKVVQKCSLPFTGARCVSTIVIDLGSPRIWLPDFYVYTSALTSSVCVLG